MGLRENQLDHSSAGMCYRTHKFMGTWIEIRMLCSVILRVAPRMVRGLKSLCFCDVGYVPLVALLTGAWIEMLMLCTYKSFSVGAPHGCVD